MNYQAFATLYDTLMADAPYGEWIHFLNKQLNVTNLEGQRILDVGCGTGELLVRLKQQGADVTGVDLSAEMLTIAKEKCEQYGFSPLLIQQSMTDLEDLGQFDVVTLFCDSLNYLETEQDVVKTFECINKLLKKGGYLLFDVHSVSKIENGFIGQTFAEDAGEVAYIWTSFEGVAPHSVEHELTFFVQNESHHYEKKFELHKQRTFPVEQYKKWLQKGYDDITVQADFTSFAPTAESERIFFSCRKKD
ncbi:class I SAM-dependent methyltransferase [Alkalihalobacillus sp. MEB130]|uniref:class I SAM-dependent DNA methyltransferase n=1 Tax=Alkalihalobacillus sp. MEB130 TaxID=2976704 RepID=UPI0028DE3A5B|nr:class I SAM-dependent methyltransferase [Alkalihalobacillus sp. MEB130]MDT8861435.1 class I SAM-dependent methyltransferase [Alkalihalobacillus sp. MEB130]